MPMAMRKMTVGDVIGTSGVEEAAVAYVHALSLDDTMEPKLVRKKSKKANEISVVPETERKTRGMSVMKNKTIQKVSKTKLLASSLNDKQTNSAERSAYKTPALKTGKKVTKSNTIGVTPQCSKSFQRTQPPRSRCLSSGGEPLFMDGGLPFVNIPLNDKQSLCFVGDDLEKVDASLLDNEAVLKIEKLMNQLSVLCKKASINYQR
ncbi:borealin-2-like isoform X2 [Ambystoma mexicanum]